MDAATLAQIDATVDQYATAVAVLELDTQQSAQSIWSSFSQWYTAGAVASAASETAALSTASQQTTVGMTQEYLRQILEIMGLRLPTGRVTIPEIRNGADLREVYRRVAAKYVREFALSGDPTVGEDAATLRLNSLISDDLMLTRRQASQTAMAEAGLKRFRRVLRPELSKSGPCGLCVVASNRIYVVTKLMPIHDDDKCAFLPIDGDNDPGRELNEADLKKIYAAAGGTSGAALKRVRVRVDEHGELGPVLTDAKHKFRGPSDLKLKDDPQRAANMLDQLRPVLADLEKREAAGDDVTDPLRYQRGLIAQLEAIAPLQ